MRKKIKISKLKKVTKRNFGHIVKNGVKLESHEEDTIELLCKYGFSIEVIKPTNIPHSSNPDFLIEGTIWETKSPEGSKESTIDRKFHEAGHQANNFILDLRRIKLVAYRAEKEALKQFKYSRSIRRLILITKEGEVLDIRK